MRLLSVRNKGGTSETSDHKFSLSDTLAAKMSDRFD